MITGNDLKPYVFGYIETEEDGDGYLHFYRFTAKQREILALDEHKNVALASAGIRLDFMGNFTNVSFDYRFRNGVSSVYPTFDILENDNARMHVRKRERLGTEDGHFSYEMGGAGRFTLWFPTYAELSIKNLEIDGEAVPATQGRTYLAYGDSISEGAFSEMNHETYVSLIARAYGLNLLNQSVSGYTFAKYPFDDNPFRPEIITVGYGTNDWSGNSDLEEGSYEFFKEVSERYPDAEVYVITPIHRGAKAYFSKIGNDIVRMPGWENKWGITIEQARQIIKKNAEQFGFTVIDGKELLENNPAYYLADLLHPNDMGHKLYGISAVKALKEYLQKD